MKISQTCQSLIEKGLALGVNFKSGTTPSEDFLLGLSAVNRTLILGDSIIAFEFRFDLEFELGTQRLCTLSRHVRLGNWRASDSESKRLHGNQHACQGPLVLERLGAASSD